jgi:hypothetical protein
MCRAPIYAGVSLRALWTPSCPLPPSPDLKPGGINFPGLRDPSVPAAVAALSDDEDTGGFIPTLAKKVCRPLCWFLRGPLPHRPFQGDRSLSAPPPPPRSPLPAFHNAAAQVPGAKAKGKGVPARGGKTGPKKGVKREREEGYPEGALLCALFVSSRCPPDAPCFFAARSPDARSHRRSSLLPASS